jgi:hypothetical protein
MIWSEDLKQSGCHMFSPDSFLRRHTRPDGQPIVSEGKLLTGYLSFLFGRSCILLLDLDAGYTEYRHGNVRFNPLYEVHFVFTTFRKLVIPSFRVIVWQYYDRRFLKRSKAGIEP